MARTRLDDDSNDVPTGLTGLVVLRLLVADSVHVELLAVGVPGPPVVVLEVKWW